MSKWQKVTTINLLTGKVEKVEFVSVQSRQPVRQQQLRQQQQPRQQQQLIQLSSLPAGCSTAERRPFFATVDAWGGDASGNQTVKVRCICTYSRNGQHMMVGDHLWLTGEDARMIASVRHTNDGQPVKLEEYGASFRPKRGMKMFLLARCKMYAGETKATLFDIEKVNPMVYDREGNQAPYWCDGMPKNTTSPMWHNGW